MNGTSPLSLLWLPFAWLYRRIIDAADFVMHPLQGIVGVRGMAYVFVLPNLLIFGIFILLPMLTNFAYSFTGGDRLFIQDRAFVGTQNFEQLFDCPNLLNPSSCPSNNFPRAVINTAWFVVGQVSLMIGVSLLTALVLNRPIRARGFFRSVFFYPVLLSPIVVALTWKWILQENGLLNSFIVAFGGEKIAFLAHADWARFWVIIISVWSLMGFYTLILLAGLQSIPGDLYEASSIDGAGPLQQFWNITLPLLMPTMLVVIVLSTIRSVQIFDVVYAFTQGKPGTSTLYIVQFIVENGFQGASRRYGLAAAASLVMAVVLIAVSVLQFTVRDRDEVA